MKKIDKIIFSRDKYKAFYTFWKKFLTEELDEFTFTQKFKKKNADAKPSLSLIHI